MPLLPTKKRGAFKKCCQKTLTPPFFALLALQKPKTESRLRQEETWKAEFWLQINTLLAQRVVSIIHHLKMSRSFLRETFVIARQAAAAAASFSVVVYGSEDIKEVLGLFLARNRPRRTDLRSIALLLL